MLRQLAGARESVGALETFELQRRSNDQTPRTAGARSRTRARCLQESFARVLNRHLSLGCQGLLVQQGGMHAVEELVPGEITPQVFGELGDDPLVLVH